MARTRYLADTSVFAHLTRPRVAAAFAPLVAEARVALCAPVTFELGYAARGALDYRDLMERLSAFPGAPTTDSDHRRALEIQSALDGRGQRRALSLVDGLVAAIAEARQLVVLHYDADFELVAEVTGQAQEWIVPRGTAG